MAESLTRIQVYLKTQRRLARFCRREKFISYDLASEIIDNWLDAQAGKQPATGTPGTTIPAASTSAPSTPPTAFSPADRPAAADPVHAGNAAADQTPTGGAAAGTGGVAFDPPAASLAHDSPGEAA